jgi:catechol 2,3-dioxygenase-like lactoylglutathione lyase family enzyme
VFDHVTIRVSDRRASERFYETVLAELGVDKTYRTRTFAECGDFSLTGSDDANPLTRRLHVGFVAPTREHVEAFWRAGTEAGFADDGPPVRGTPSENVHLAFATDDDGDVRRFHEAATGAGYRSKGPPGERTRYHPGYYAAYVLDPDGNNVEVVNHHPG